MLIYSTNIYLIFFILNNIKSVFFLLGKIFFFSIVDYTVMYFLRQVNSYCFQQKILTIEHKSTKNKYILVGVSINF